MSEEVQPKPEKQWTPWSVVRTEGGEYRCKRSNVGDGSDVEYRPVDRPLFERDELRDMVAFGTTRLLTPDQIADAAFDNRYRAEAFRVCSGLNATAEAK